MRFRRVDVEDLAGLIYLGPKVARLPVDLAPLHLEPSI